MITKDQILGALPQLSVNDLQALQAVIGELLGQRAIQVPVIHNSLQAWLYEAMAATLNSPQSYTSFMATGAAKQFTKNAPIGVAFVMGTFTQANASKVKALAIMRHLLDLLATDLRAKKIPVTRNTVTSNLIRLPEIFERNYPGYIRAGLVDLIQPWR